MFSKDDLLRAISFSLRADADRDHSGAWTLTDEMGQVFRAAIMAMDQDEYFAIVHEAMQILNLLHTEGKSSG
ncbi:hypothetical protein [Desulfonatronum parangueonense]